MIAITGGAGFIGSALAHHVNQQGETDLLLVDELGRSDKWKNLVSLEYTDYLEKEEFLTLVESDSPSLQPIKGVFHLGACSSTTETDASYLMENNFAYTKSLAVWCHQKKIPLVYASSAATYGNGDQGYDDKESELPKLRPLNMYGYSKHLFDSWAHKTGLLQSIVGLKYFNVFGPNEYHKEDMRSVILKAFEQIQTEGRVKLFESHRSDYKHGEQQRDFLYVKDAVAMTWHCYRQKIPGGLYNIGTGNPRTWLDLVKALFHALDREPQIEFIPMPDHLRDKYQYYTQAPMKKFLATGYNGSLFALEEAVADYAGYLKKGLARLGEAD